MCRRKPRPRLTDPKGRMPVGRVCGVSFLLLIFSLDKHCAAGAARTPKAARRAEGRMPGVKRSKSDPAEGDETSRQHCRRRVNLYAVAKERTARSRWLPAFAGMKSSWGGRTGRVLSPPLPPA